MSYDSTVLADSPVGFWPLNEASGTTAFDKSGNGNNGTYGASCTLGATGIGDGETAVSFPALSTGTISVSDNAVLDIGDVVSLEAWVNPTVVNTIMGIIGKGSGSYLMRLNASGKLDFLRSQITDMVQSTSALTASVWTYVVCTKNGSTIHLYINAVDVTGTVTNSTFANNSNALTIGNDTGDSVFFNGVIAKPAVYNYVLTPTQVSAHFAASKPYVPIYPVFLPRRMGPQAVGPTFFAALQPVQFGTPAQPGVLVPPVYLPQRLGPGAAGPMFFAAHPALRNPLGLAQPLTAGLTFTGRGPQNAIGKGMAAVLSFTGVRAVAIGKGITAALSFTGARAVAVGKGMAATLTFTGAALRNAIGKGIVATLTFTGAQARAIGTHLSAALTFAGAVTKNIPKVLSAAALSFAGTVTSSITRFVAPAIKLAGLVFPAMRAGRTNPASRPGQVNPTEKQGGDSA